MQTAFKGLYKSCLFKLCSNYFINAFSTTLIHDSGDHGGLFPLTGPIAFVFRTINEIVLFFRKSPSTWRRSSEQRLRGCDIILLYNIHCPS